MSHRNAGPRPLPSGPAPTEPDLLRPEILDAPLMNQLDWLTIDHQPLTTRNTMKILINH